MIRCVRLWTGAEDDSHVAMGTLEILPGRNDDLVSPTMASTHVTVEETAGGGTLAWHTAPVRQLVVTLSGTLDFTTRDGEQFTLHPGDVLLAEDTAGSGHQWQLRGHRPVAPDVRRAGAGHRRAVRPRLALSERAPRDASEAQWPATMSASSISTGSLAPGRNEYAAQTIPKNR